MPRVEDRLLKAVIYLYESEDAAYRGDPGGSGFLIGVPSEIPNSVFLYAVTNAHVAKHHSQPHPVIRTAGSGKGRVIVRSAVDWLGYPERQDDVVVTPFGFAPLDSRDFHVDYVPRHWFVTPEHFTEASDDETQQQPIAWPFGPGEEVVMVGRFLGFDGMEENRPAARFGHLAMADPVPLAHPWGFAQTSFIVECRSVSGFSGSPVFIFRATGTISAGLTPIGSTRHESHLVRADPRLLGIDWGNLDRVGQNDYAIDWAQSETMDTFPRRSGMLVAVPAWNLADLLDSKEVVNVQKDVEQKVKEQTKGVELDYDNLSEFERFEALTQKLATTPKPKPDAENES